MRTEQLNELLEKKFITPEQHQQLDAIVSKRVFSVFYELRTLLYLGVMLFATGAGILIYLNIGEVGHVLSIIALFLLSIACFVYAFKKGAPYTHAQVKSPTPYFDYVVLLGCLLFISVQGYLQFQYNLLDENLELSTLLTAGLFFYVAYRFDHAGVLSLAITALASFFSLSLSPQKWYSGDFFDTENLHVIALCFGGVLGAVAMVLEKRGIKKHFTFSYLNFSFLLFLPAALAGMFEEELTPVYFMLLCAGCATAVWVAHEKKSFLFLLYAFIAGYIGITYLLIQADFFEEVWYLYMMASCGGFIVFIIKFKNYFKREA